MEATHCKRIGWGGSGDWSDLIGITRLERDRVTHNPNEEKSSHRLRGVHVGKLRKEGIMRDIGVLRTHLDEVDGLH